MNIRTKTKRRVAILLTVALVLIVSAAGIYLYARAQRQAMFAERRTAGLAAAKAGDFVEALPLLSRYVGEHQQDVEAVYYYSLARRRVEDPRGAHIDEPIVGFRQVLMLDPSHGEARRELLELYIMRGYAVEAIELARGMLPSDAKAYKAEHVPTLMAMARAHAQQNKLEEGIRWAEQVLRVDPVNLEAQSLILKSRELQGRNASERHQIVTQWIEANPEAPESDILRALALRLQSSSDAAQRRQNRDAALQALQRAASHRAPTEGFINALISAFDVEGWFEESLQALIDHAPACDDKLHKRHLARRLLERGEHQRLLELFADVTPENKLAHTDLLAIKAEALLATGGAEGPARAQPYLDALEQRAADPFARAWWLVLTELRVPMVRQAAGAADPASPEMLRPVTLQQHIDILDRALTADPTNPFVRHRLGDVYAALGENELAMAQWERVLAHTHTWSTPMTRIARMMLTLNRPVQALEMSLDAMLRNHRDALASLTYIEALDQAHRRGLTERVAQVLRERNPDLSTDPLVYLDQIQRKTPGEPHTLPMYIDLLAAAGRQDEALKLLEGAMSNDQLPQQALLTLAATSHRRKLGHTDELLNLAEKRHGMSPELASTRAAMVADTGRLSEAMAYMQRMVEQHGRDKPEWQVTYARMLDRINDPRALDTWRSLGSKYAQNVAVQRLMLNAQAVRQDRQLMQETMLRLKELTGETALSWQLAHARWLLSPPAGQPQVAPSAAREAIDLLNPIVTASPHLVEARELLAGAYLVLGNQPAAIDQLIAIVTQQPHRSDIHLRLAQLYYAAGQREQTIAMLQQAAEQGPTDVERRGIATLYERMGDPEKAIATLEQLGEPDVHLAELYYRYRTLGPSAGAADYLERARKMYEQLMQQPSPPVIASYALFLASQGQRPAALEALGRLESLGVAASERHRVLADFNRRFPDPAGRQQSNELAAHQLKQATEEAPENRMAWLSRIEHLLSMGEVDQAMAVTAAAVKHHAKDPVFTLVAENEAVIRATLRDAATVPLVGAVLNDDAHRQVAIEALRVIHQASQANRDPQNTQKQTLEQVTAKLRAIADSSPRFLALNRYLVDVYASVGRPQQAVEVAQRLSRLLPNAPAAQHVLISALLLGRPGEDPGTAAQRQQDALLLARRIMDDFPTDARSAELAARIYAMKQQWREAIAAATEWRKRSGGNPEADVFLAEAYLSVNEADRALAQIEPYLREGAPSLGIVPVALKARILIHQAGTDAARRDALYEQAENLLKPHLAESAEARLFWMSFADRQISQRQSDHARAARWLQRVEPVLNEDAAEERLTLASSWRHLGERATGPAAAEYSNHAVRLASAAADVAQKRHERQAKMDIPAEQRRLVAAANAAVIGEYAGYLASLGDGEAAIAQYRRALGLYPIDAQNRNNLAMLLAESAAQLRTQGAASESQVKAMLDEALSLAKGAVEARTLATFLDTLSYVHTLRGEHEQAIANLSRATQLEDHRAEWWVNLARACIERAEQLAPQDAKADAALDALRRSTAALDEVQRRRLPMSPKVSELHNSLLQRTDKLQAMLASKVKKAA